MNKTAHMAVWKASMVDKLDELDKVKDEFDLGKFVDKARYEADGLMRQAKLVYDMVAVFEAIDMEDLAEIIEARATAEGE